MFVCNVHMDVQSGCVRLAGNGEGGRLIGIFCWFLELQWNKNFMPILRWIGSHSRESSS